MTITNELLDELEAKAKAAIPACCGEMIPTGVEYGGQREMMCCEAWQDCDVTVDALDLLALVEHIRSQAAELEKAEKDAALFRHLMFNHVERAGDGNVLLKFGPYPEQQLRKTISAAIAQEGAGHE